MEASQEVRFSDGTTLLLSEGSNDGMYQGFSLIDLEVAFDMVKNAVDWKAPIRASIPTFAVPITVAAIEFYTATTAEVDAALTKGYSIVKSIGYRNGPAGDH